MYTKTLRWMALIVVAAVFASGCGAEEFSDAQAEEFSDAQITSLTLSRSTFTVSETGMTDEFITAEVSYIGFFDPVDPDRSEIFLQEFDRAADPMSATVDGNTVLLEGIATSWLSVGAGTHNIGATVTTDSESVTQLNLATVTITE